MKRVYATVTTMAAGIMLSGALALAPVGATTFQGADASPAGTATSDACTSLVNNYGWPAQSTKPVPYDSYNSNPTELSFADWFVKVIQATRAEVGEAAISDVATTPESGSSDPAQEALGVAGTWTDCWANAAEVAPSVSSLDQQLDAAGLSSYSGSPALGSGTSLFDSQYPNLYAQSNPYTPGYKSWTGENATALAVAVSCSSPVVIEPEPSSGPTGVCRVGIYVGGPDYSPCSYCTAKDPAPFTDKSPYYTTASPNELFPNAPKITSCTAWFTSSGQLMANVHWSASDLDPAGDDPLGGYAPSTDPGLANDTFAVGTTPIPGSSETSGTAALPVGDYALTATVQASNQLGWGAVGSGTCSQVNVPKQAPVIVSMTATPGRSTLYQGNWKGTGTVTVRFREPDPTAITGYGAFVPNSSGGSVTALQGAPASYVYSVTVRDVPAEANRVDVSAGLSNGSSYFSKLENVLVPTAEPAPSVRLHSVHGTGTGSLRVTVSDGVTGSHAKGIYTSYAVTLQQVSASTHGVKLIRKVEMSLPATGSETRNTVIHGLMPGVYEVVAVGQEPTTPGCVPGPCSSGEDGGTITSKVATATVRATPRCGHKACRGLGQKRRLGMVVGVAPAGAKGAFVLTSKGAVGSYGTASTHGSATGRLHHGVKAVAISSNPEGSGYYVLASNGAVFRFGSVPKARSIRHPAGRVVGIAVDAAGTGYVVATNKGHLYAFGTAHATKKVRLDRGETVTGISADPATKNGYYVLTSKGRVISVGGAHLFGSARTKSTLGISSDATGAGYCVLASSSSVRCFGQTGPNSRPHVGKGLVAVTFDPVAGGYYLVAAAGTLYWVSA